MQIDIARSVRHLKALSNPTRFKIFMKILSQSSYYDTDEEPILAENTVSSISKSVELSQATVSHHVSKLKQAGLVRAERKGSFTYLLPQKQFLENLGGIIEKLKSGIDRERKIKPTLRINRAIELEEFKNAVEYMCLHGFSLLGPTELKSSAGTLRYYLRRETARHGELIELTYSALNGNIFMRVNPEAEEVLKDDINQLNQLLANFFLKNP
ncbi:MAG: ArsR/SmtB family transcription factor [Candidatus Dojkabacteria bacterium]